MKKILLAALCFSAITNFAQDFEQNEYSWSPEPKRVEISENDKKYDYVSLIHHHYSEVIIDEEGEYLFETFHTKNRIVTDAGVEANNTIHLPLHEKIEILEIKARTIDKNGKIVNFDKDNMKKVENLDGQGDYNLLAIDGIEVGSDVEYIFKLKKPASIMGSEHIQASVPVKDFIFQLITPESFVFKAHGFNNCPEFTDSISDEDEKQFITIKSNEIQPLDEEKYSLHDANLMRLDYKFSHVKNSGNGEYGLNTNVVQSMYKKIYTDKKAIKTAKKKYKKMKISDKSEEEQIEHILGHGDDLLAALQSLGNYNITISGGGNLNGIEEKARIFEIAGIKHEIVMGISRYETDVPEEFESPLYLENTYMYFPGTNKYAKVSLFGANNYGYLPFSWTNTHALFMKRISIGGQDGAIPEIRFVEGTNLMSKDNIEVKVVFDDEMESPKCEFVKSLFGYSGMDYHNLAKYLKDEQKEEVTNDLAKGILGEDTEVKECEIDSLESKVNPFDVPFVYRGTISNPNLLENAGKNYLFNVGKLIGPQANMYKDKDRKLDIDCAYKHELNRTIKFTIPEGYDAKGLDKLNIDIQRGEDGKDKTCGFISSYKVNGNEVEVTIKEFYYQVQYNKEFITKFREVINAAADFNKVVVVFETK